VSILDWGRRSTRPGPGQLGDQAESLPRRAIYTSFPNWKTSQRHAHAVRFARSAGRKGTL